VLLLCGGCVRVWKASRYTHCCAPVPVQRGMTALDLAINNGCTEVVSWFTDQNVRCCMCFVWLPCWCRHPSDLCAVLALPSDPTHLVLFFLFFFQPVAQLVYSSKGFQGASHHQIPVHDSSFSGAHAGNVYGTLSGAAASGRGMKSKKSSRRMADHSGDLAAFGVRARERSQTWSCLCGVCLACCVRLVWRFCGGVWCHQCILTPRV